MQPNYKDLVIEQLAYRVNFLENQLTQALQENSELKSTIEKAENPEKLISLKDTKK